MRINATLAMTRLQMGMTQKKMAAHLRVAASTVSDYERGRRIAPRAYVAQVMILADRVIGSDGPIQPPPLGPTMCAQCPVGQALEARGRLAA